MDDNTPERDPNISQPEPEYLSRREERWRRREERRAARGGRSGGAWIGGAILIALGIIFLLQNLGAATLENWWALFILIPAVGAFGNAWRSYQAAGGHLTASARGSLIGGFALTMVAAIFLFNLSWGLLGPLLIILVGIGLLLNAFLPG
jgi:hypothetical protein